MRKLICTYAFASLLASGTVSAQTWSSLTSEKKTNEHHIAANGDAAYVAAKYHGYSSYSLFKVDGNSLKEVWQPEYKQPQFDVALEVDPKGVPYLACKEGDFLLVKRLDGKKMVDVSDEALSSKGTNYFKFTLDRSGTPYVFYIMNSKLVVKKLNGRQWEQVLETPEYSDYKVAFNSKNELYVTSKNTKSVRKLENGALVNVGPAYAKMMDAHFGVYFDNKDELYVVYTSFENYPKPSGVPKVIKLTDVKQADGKMAKEWKMLPDPTEGTEFKDKGGELVNLAWDSNNNMYFACSFRSPSGNTVQKFDGTKWVAADGGIDGDNKKAYDGKKRLVFGKNTLLMSRPLMSAKL